MRWMTPSWYAASVPPSGDTPTELKKVKEAERDLRAQGDDYGLAVSLVNLCDAALALGDAEFEEAWAQGAQMTFDQAAEYAFADGAS